MKEETIPVTIVLPKTLADLVDEKAKKELRSRSGQIAKIISEYFRKEGIDNEYTKRCGH